jgi:hypothetical protein
VRPSPGLASARALITELAGAQLLQAVGAEGSLATITNVGERLYVLSTVLERANVELADV